MIDCIKCCWQVEYRQNCDVPFINNLQDVRKHTQNGSLSRKYRSLRGLMIGNEVVGLQMANYLSRDSISFDAIGKLEIGVYERTSDGNDWEVHRWKMSD